MKVQRPGLSDNYTKTANVLIQGYPELSLQDRYVAIGLISLYWDEKVYPVSLRELAAKIHVDHTSLRSRSGKRPSEGVLDRLWRFGIIGLMEGKPTTETGNKGRVQTYLTVNHSEIATQNARFALEKKSKSSRNTVVNDNSKKPTDENTVVPDNHTVVISNDSVVIDNHTVVHASVKTPPITSNTMNNIEDIFTPQIETSYSQEITPPTPEKKEGPSMADWLAELDTKIDALNQQYQVDSSRLQEKHNNQSSNPTLFQETAPAESAPKVVFNDMTKDLNNEPAKPLTSKQIATLRKQRMADIMALADKEVGTALPRSPKTFVQEALDDLVNADRTDEQIIFSIKDIKARGRDLNFTEIAKNMASAVTKLKNGEQPGKIIPFDPRNQQPQAKVATTPGRKALDEITARQDLIRSQPPIEHTRRFAR